MCKCDPAYSLTHSPCNIDAEKAERASFAEVARILLGIIYVHVQQQRRMQRAGTPILSSLASESVYSRGNGISQAVRLPSSDEQLLGITLWIALVSLGLFASARREAGEIFYVRYQSLRPLCVGRLGREAIEVRLIRLTTTVNASPWVALSLEQCLLFIRSRRSALP